MDWPNIQICVPVLCQLTTVYRSLPLLVGNQLGSLPAVRDQKCRPSALTLHKNRLKCCYIQPTDSACRNLFFFLSCRVHKWDFQKLLVLLIMQMEINLKKYTSFHLQEVLFITLRCSINWTLSTIMKQLPILCTDSFRKEEWRATRKW